MRKPKLILPLIFVVTLWPISSQASWFWNNDQQRQQQIDTLNGELNRQERSNGNMQVVILVLGVGCVVTLVIGAAIGSKARRAANGRRE